MFDRHLEDKNYATYLKLLWKLHQADLESAIADGIRDEMDGYWKLLSQEQVDLSNHISAVFYVIKENDV